MDWGSFGVINNHVHSQRVTVMASKKPVDTVWEEIFDSLVLESEPPHKYVKRVIITTRDGRTFHVTPEDFAALIEHERSLPPGSGAIMSAKMSLDFAKIKRDVDKWTDQILDSFDRYGRPVLPKFPKPEAGTIKRRGRPRKVKVTDAEPVTDLATPTRPKIRSTRKPKSTDN